MRFDDLGYDGRVEGLITRHAEPLARSMLAHSPGLVIEGARQVGKSTLARQLVDGRNAILTTLDDEQTRAAVAEDMPGFLAQATDGTLVIDEIQRLPEITLAIKAAIDRDRRPGRFILTGSASLLRLRGLADSMAGRVLRLPLYGFSQGELRDRPDDFVTRVVTTDPSELVRYRSDSARQNYAEIIGRGAYPDSQPLPSPLRGRWLDSYLAGIVRRDLGELRRQVDPSRTESLLRALAGNQSGELVKARLATATSIPAATVTSYLDLLTDVGLVATIGPWTPNLAKREVGRRKAYVIDSGLGTRLARISSEQLARFDHGEAFGSFLEGFVATELLRQQTWSGEEFELFHYRDRAGLDVDLVAELTGGRVIGIDVKASTSLRRGHFDGLRALRDRLGDRFVAGVVLNTGAEGYRYAERLYGLPIDALWSL